MQEVTYFHSQYYSDISRALIREQYGLLHITIDITLAWIRCTLSFSLLQSAALCTDSCSDLWKSVHLLSMCRCLSLAWPHPFPWHAQDYWCLTQAKVGLADSPKDYWLIDSLTVHWCSKQLSSTRFLRTGGGRAFHLAREKLIVVFDGLVDGKEMFSNNRKAAIKVFFTCKCAM